MPNCLTLHIITLTLHTITLTLHTITLTLHTNASHPSHHYLTLHTISLPFTPSPYPSHHHTHCLNASIPVWRIGPAESRYVFPSTSDVLTRPGLDSQELMEYFRCNFAREKNEILLAVEWGICQLPSCFLCGIEAGLFVSNSSLYLVEVTAQSSNNQWKSKSLPLRLVVQASLEELCQVTSGAGDQYLIVEFSRRVATQIFVMFPCARDGSVSIVRHIMAALDGYSIPHDSVTTRKKEFVSVKEKNVVNIVSEMENGHQRIREEIVRDYLSVKAASCDVSLEEFYDIDSELDIKKASSKIAITHHMVCWEMVSDVIPSSTGVCSLQLRALVMTQDGVYLCREDVLSPLVMGSIPLCPPSLLSYVLDFRPISEVACIKECDKANLSLSPSNSLYQFSIAFSGGDTTAGGGSRGEWVFCVPNSQLMDQFISSLDHAWRGLHGSPLPHVHTPVPLLVLEQGPRPPLPQEGGDRWGPRFYHNRALLELCTSSYDKKVEFFKETCSTPGLDKAGDRELQAFFMALCRPSYHSLVEIEVCMVVSKMSISLVSSSADALDWNDRRGSLPINTAAKQAAEDTSPPSEPLCVVRRIWLCDIKEVDVGLFYLSVQLKTAGGGTPNEEGVVIIPQLAASTLALLGAISGAVDLRDVVTEETMLRDFDDVTDDPVTMSVSTRKAPAQRSSTCFRQGTEETGELASLLASYSSEKTSRQTPRGAVKVQPGKVAVVSQQVMLVLADKVNTQVTSVGGHPPCHPHLVLLTNRGLYMCSNDSYTHHSPAVLRAQQLRVQRWCPIEQVGHIEVTMSEHGIRIHLLGHVHTTSTVGDHPKHTSTQNHPKLTSAHRGGDQPKHGSVHPDQSTHSLVPPPTIHLIAQNSELVSSFVYLLSLLWREKNGGKALNVVHNGE